MSLNEQLKGLNLPKDKIEAIENILKNEYVTKYDFDRLSDNLNALVVEHKKKEEFIQNAAEDQLARQKAGYEKKIKRYLLEKAVVEARAKNTDIVISLLRLDKIALNGDNLSGVDEQLVELKKNAPFLFDDAVMLLTGYCPEAASDILPKVNFGDMTYSQTVAYLEKEKI